MVVCDFDLNFTFISCGWEGSATDAKVLRSALNSGFHVPPGKFYLVDGGYANTPYFLAPYRGVRYHLKEFARDRAQWNASLEKDLVDLLREHDTPEHKGQNGWSSEAWNTIVKKFHQKNPYARYEKKKIQEKEKELKKEYKMIKEIRKQSGVSWDDQQCRILADPPLWKNIIISHPKAGKFKTKAFPLFEALGELHDGQTAEGTYNFTSIESSHCSTQSHLENLGGASKNHGETSADGENLGGE
ncbi:uncharacterized protein, partial [Triticum aestivum]|uniref:uncharacterized protein n=1 Tax=Triticum aestivum TaxID=4565 RepID=UPI001D032E0D